MSNFNEMLKNYEINHKMNLLKKIKRIVTKINLEEIKSTPEDIYWQRYTDYMYKFKHYEEVS